MHNRLSRNPAKYELSSSELVAVPSTSFIHSQYQALQCNYSIISQKAWCHIDQHLSLDQHINNGCKACYYHIQSLHHVCRSLQDDGACSMVTSRIDYCNSLYAGMSASNLKKLQRVQNTLARVVLQLRRRDHSTPALVQLHWLPNHHRVTFKIVKYHLQPAEVSPTILPVSVCSAVHSI